jgi:hypothetical protein
MVRRGPCEGLLDWPRSKWERVTPSPLSLGAAVALANAHDQHAVVNVWGTADVAHDNGKAPKVPNGWWPAEAQTALDKKA